MLEEVSCADMRPLSLSCLVEQRGSGVHGHPGSCIAGLRFMTHFYFSFKLNFPTNAIACYQSFLWTNICLLCFYKNFTHIMFIADIFYKVSFPLSWVRALAS